MKKATNRILSFLTAFAMVIGVLVAPFTSANAADTGETTSTEVTEPGTQPNEATEQEKTKEGAPADEAEASTTSTIDIHKIVMDAADLSNWKPEENRTNGGKIEDKNIKKFFGAKSKEVAGVYFEVYKEVKAGTAGATSGEELNKKYPSKEIDTTKAYQKVAEKKTEANGTGNINLTEFIDKDEKDEKKVKDTKFIIVENLEKSDYKEKDDKGNVKTLSKDGKAIPSAIVLPATIMGGDVLHLYPKNTDTEKPEVVKDYKDEFNTGDAAKTDALNNKRDQDTINKDKKDHQIGDKLDYRVETLFKENTSYKTAYWEDNMTAGLTYNKDVKVTIDGKEVQGLTKTEGDPIEQELKGKDYVITRSDDRGYYLYLTETGLEKVNGKDKHLVALEYSATLNEKAIVNIPETNDVDFFYGNDQRKGNTPKSTKPKDGVIKVTKTWDDGEWAKGEKAKFQLVDASTGEVVKSTDVKTVEDYTFENPVEIGYDAKNGGSYEWKGLDNEKSYKVVEINRTDGEEASYEAVKDEKGNLTGEIKVVNHKGNNKEVNPKEPKVVHHGKKFVKLDDKTNKRLPKAEFVVMNSDKTKYLAQKSDEETANDRQAYTEAKAIYDQYIADKDQTNADTQYEKVKKAHGELNTKYYWVESTDPKKDTDTDKLVRLKSNDNGQFAIDGLADGTYYLKETKAPNGYAEIKEEKEFTVSADSWASQGNIEFTKNQEGKDKIAAEGTSAMKVENKNLTIPQTGGIGSLIFIVAGLAIMGLAFVMKRRNTVEA